MTVVAFPGAGSYGREFGPLRDRLGRVVTLQYPGRVGPDQGTPAASFADLVAACVAGVRRRAPAGGVLVGHSFGGYVAYATAAALGTAVDALVVVGANAPDRFALPAGVTASPAAAWAFLVGAGADPAPGGEWQDIAADTAWRDLVLLTGFPGPAATRLRAPVLAVRGTHDPLTTDAGLAGWADTTDGGCAVLSAPGGHADVLADPAFLDRVAALVRPEQRSTR